MSALCNTFWTQAVSFGNRLNAGASNQDNPFPNLLNLVTAPNDLAIIFSKMDVVAPEDIEPDIAALRDAFQSLAKSEGDSITDPLKAIAGNLGTGLSSMGSFERVNQYLSTNCGNSPPPGLTVIPPSPAGATPSYEVSENCDGSTYDLSFTAGTAVKIVFHTKGLTSDAHIRLTGPGGQTLISGDAPALQATTFTFTAPAGAEQLAMNSGGNLLESCQATVDYYLAGGQFITEPPAMN